MNRWVFALLLTSVLFDPINALADETIPGEPVPFNTGREFLTSDNQPPELLLQALARGWPVDRGFISKTLPADAAYHTLTKLREEASTNKKATLAQAEALFNWGKQYERDSLATANHQPKPETAHFVAVFPLNERRLVDCAIRTLPILKLALASKIRGDALNAIRLLQLADDERGDGKLVRSEGIACGKYLGDRGSSNISAIDEIKFLSSLLAVGKLSQGQRRLFWKYQRLYSNVYQNSLARPLQEPMFWSYAWKRVSFALVFGRSEIQTVEAIFDDYLADHSGQGAEERNYALVDGNGSKARVLADWSELK